jgi:AraC-like DNA-binding protein
VVEGDGWASVAGREPIPFGSGDILVFPHGDSYLMESAPGTPSELDTEETIAFFRALAAGELPFVVTEGGGQPPRAKFICGFLGCDVRPFNPILSSLPRLLRLQRPQESRSDLLDRLIDLTLNEAQAPRTGSESIRLGLSELMFIELLRCYADAPGEKAQGWITGLQDAAVARALEIIHEQPAASWTVSSLARRVGASRSALAQCFAALVGHPPVRYLTLWRMQLAAGYLSQGTLPIAEIAYRVGYHSEAAFSRTFKKVAGVSPDAWRRTGRQRQSV